MCGLPAASLIMGIASAGASVYGGYQQQKAQREQAKFAAAQALAQRDAALDTAKHTQDRAESSYESVRKTRSKGEGERMDFIRRAKFARQQRMQKTAKGGKSVYQETDLEEDQLMEQLTDEGVIRLFKNTEREAFGYQQQGDDEIFRAEQLLKGADQYGMNAAFYSAQANAGTDYISLAGSLLGDASTIAGNYSKFKGAGAFGKKKGRRAAERTFSAPTTGYDPYAFTSFEQNGFF